MNSQPFPRPPLNSLTRNSRAALSPVRSIRRRALIEPAVPASSTEATLLRFVQDAGVLPVASRPAWHRGTLDRLQPMLTRYRD